MYDVLHSRWTFYRCCTATDTRLSEPKVLARLLSQINDSSATMVKHDHPVLPLLLIPHPTAPTITTDRSPKQADGELSDRPMTRSSPDD